MSHYNATTLELSATSYKNHSLANMWVSYGDWTFAETSDKIEEVSVLFVFALEAAEQQKTLYCKELAS